MKFLNNHGIEIILSPGVATAKGRNPEGKEIKVKLDKELAESINYLYNLDIYDLEKIRLKNKIKFNYESVSLT